MNKEALTEVIKREALNSGFSKIGIAPAAILYEDLERLKEWVKEGKNADMQWMANNMEIRANAFRHMPEVKSVISLALNYNSPFEHSNRTDRGKISRYAWGEDYHVILKQKFVEFEMKVKQHHAGIRFKYFCDTGSTLEKAWAQRSGIGWRGKHSLIVTREFGSWFFLCTVLTDQELEYERELENFCGDCTRCSDACPTKALQIERVLDSNKCISYVTIEHHASSALSQNTGLHGWVYGCDLCQNVCPWNATKNYSTEPQFAPRYGETELPLSFILSMTHEEFSNRFQNSPIKHGRLERLVRNAKIVSDETMVRNN
jgi:epoxyqueuosine reductase